MDAQNSRKAAANVRQRTQAAPRPVDPRPVDSTAFFGFAVGAGFVLIGLVVYSYVRPQPEHRPSVTALLGLLGFALVASPNWAAISIRSDGLELSLLREMQARQLQALTDLQTRVASPAAPAPPAAEAVPAPDPAAEAPAPPRAPQPGVAPPAPTEPEAREVHHTVRAEAVPSRLTPERQAQLVEAYGRGELDLRTLTNAELLGLNERFSERVRGQPQRRPAATPSDTPPGP